MIKKKIIIEDGLCIIDGTGPGQYTLGIIKALKELNYDVKIQKKTLLEKIKNKNYRRIIYLIWLNTVFLLKTLFLNKETTVIYTNYSVPFIKVGASEQIAVIHDLCSYKFPQTMTNIQNFYSIMATDNAAKKADKILTASNTGKNEIVDQFKNLKDRAYVVNCINTVGLHIDTNTDETEFFKNLNLSNREYIMSVSTFNQRKNVMSLIDAFNLLSKDYPELKLVLVGGNGNDTRIESIKQKNKNIIFTGYISDDELSLLYKKAKLYIFPSVYEGFGIPIIDAQKFGVPLLCSDIPVFREIAGNGAEFCEPTSQKLAEKIKYLLSNEARRNELINLEGENVKRYNIENIAKQLKALLDNV